MKKLITIALALALVFALSVSAFAAEVPAANITGGTSQNGKIDITKQESASAGNIYSVGIVWDSKNAEGDLVKDTYTWTPSIKKYVKSTNPTFTPAKTGYMDIQITNYSNATIYYSINAAAAEGYTVKYYDSPSGTGDGRTEAVTGSIATAARWFDQNEGTHYFEYTDTDTTGQPTSNSFLEYFKVTDVPAATADSDNLSDLVACTYTVTVSTSTNP